MFSISNREKVVSSNTGNNNARTKKKKPEKESMSLKLKIPNLKLNTTEQASNTRFFWKKAQT